MLRNRRAVVGLSAAIRFLVCALVRRALDRPRRDDLRVDRPFVLGNGETTRARAAAPFYGAYPLLVGLPLHLFGTVGRITAIQLGQAILMSLGGSRRVGLGAPARG